MWLSSLCLFHADSCFCTTFLPLTPQIPVDAPSPITDTPQTPQPLSQSPPNTDTAIPPATPPLNEATPPTATPLEEGPVPTPTESEGKLRTLACLCLRSFKHLFWHSKRCSQAKSSATQLPVSHLLKATPRGLWVTAAERVHSGKSMLN